MPELPEVHTTVTGLQTVLPKLSITSIWSDMWSDSKLAKNTIKDKSYFQYFKKYSLNQKVLQVRRRAKHILIDLENGFTIIIHMKMTGHLMYGKYKYNKKKAIPKQNSKKVVLAPRSQQAKWGPWIPLVADHADLSPTTQTNTSPLLDPYNSHIHVVFTLANNMHLVFCDSRKFGTIVIEKTSTLHLGRFAHLGPEPLVETFTKHNFKERVLLSPKRAIKTVLMDQTIVAGIGNIYSDEMLHRAHILPTRIPMSITDKEWTLLFASMKEVLNKGIDFGGDSTSDYRNILGERGSFHSNHLVYLRTKEKCLTKRCDRTIEKKTIGGRSAHFCTSCQK